MHWGKQGSVSRAPRNILTQVQKGRISVGINSGKGTVPVRFQKGTRTMSELERAYSSENKLNMTELRRSGWNLFDLRKQSNTRTMAWLLLTALNQT